MKNFQNIKKNIFLSAEKKHEMWTNIADKIAIAEISWGENVRMVGVDRPTLWGVITSSVLLPKKKYMNTAKILAAMILILWSIIGTASYAAEQSLPGQALYAFKVGVNESVRGAFAFGAEADAKWEIEKIARRAREKMELQAEAKLTAEANTEIESRSQTSAEKVQEVILRLQSEWKAEAATSLEGGLHTALNAILSGGHWDDNGNNNSDVSSDTDAQVDSDVKVHVPAVNVRVNGQNTNNSSTNSNTSTNNHASSETNTDVDAEVNLDLDVSAQSSTSNSNNSSSTSSSGSVDAAVDATVDTASHLNL